MKDPRKTILISGIISLILAVLSIAIVYLDLITNFSWIILIYDIISITISFVVGIYMIVISKFDFEKLAKQQKIFFNIYFHSNFWQFYYLDYYFLLLFCTIKLFKI